MQSGFLPALHPAVRVGVTLMNLISFSTWVPSAAIWPPPQETTPGGTGLPAACPADVRQSQDQPHGQRPQGDLHQIWRPFAERNRFGVPPSINKASGSSCSRWCASAGDTPVTRAFASSTISVQVFATVCLLLAACSGKAPLRSVVGPSVIVKGQDRLPEALPLCRFHNDLMLCQDSAVQVGQ